jgi:hypothetical protein
MVMIGEKPWVRVSEVSDTYGQFVVEPLERGYGATLGNSLRRVLLSSCGASLFYNVRSGRGCFTYFAEFKGDSYSLSLRAA